MDQAALAEIPMKQFYKDTVILREEDYYMGLCALSKYASISSRKLRSYLRDPINPLPYYRLERKILVKKSEFDEWLKRESQRHKIDLDNLVDEVLKDWKL